MTILKSFETFFHALPAGRCMAVICLMGLWLVACGDKESRQHQRPAQDHAPTPVGTVTGVIPGYDAAAEIVRDAVRSVWAERKEETASLALHFVPEQPDTVSVSFSPECWLEFPCRAEGDAITVYWDQRVDSKYEFEFVKSVRRADPAYRGKPFMVLTLLNDSTLRAAYPIPALVKALNSAGQGRTLFPETFTLQRRGFFR